MNVWIRESGSGADRQVTRGTGAAMQAAWSPDGSRIAFSDPDGQIQVVDVATGTTRMAHERLNEAGRASWSPDGSALVVSSLKVYSTRFREGTNQVLRISLGGQPDRWFDPMPHKSIGMREDYGPVWSPDGAQMAAIVDGLLTVWPVARDGTPRGSPRPLLDRARRIADVDRRLTAHPVSERRSAPAGRRRVGPRSCRRSSRASRGRLPRRPPARRRFTPAGSGTAAPTPPQANIDIVVDGGRIKSVEPHSDALPRRHGRRCVEGNRHPRARLRSTRT